MNRAFDTFTATAGRHPLYVLVTPSVGFDAQAHNVFDIIAAFIRSQVRAAFDRNTVVRHNNPTILGYLAAINLNNDGEITYDYAVYLSSLDGAILEGMIDLVYFI